MKINSLIDSNAIALSMRNFGHMPPSTASLWMQHLTTEKITQLPYPQKAVIEIANTCNLDCPMCRVGQFGINLNRVMPLRQFERIIDELVDIKIVRLNGLGESTLVPNFEAYLKVLHGKGIVVELISNGSGNSDIYSSILKKQGVVIISWDAAEKKVFEILRRPAKWEPYEHSIIDLAVKAKANKSTDRLFLLFTLQRLNIMQLSMLVEKCKGWGIDNVIVNVVKLANQDWIAAEFNNIQQEFLIARNLAEKLGIALLLPEDINGRNIEIAKALKTSATHCTMPWDEVVIRWNGDIQVCNMFNPYIYGNIFLNDFETVWNNCFANTFRKYVNTNKKHPYCNGCVYIKDAYEYRKV